MTDCTSASILFAGFEPAEYGYSLMATTGKSVLAVGIEVGNFDLVRDWIDSGALPTLASLSRQGTLTPATTVTEISSGSIWPTFYTGTNPLRNGQFFTHMQLRNGSYKIDKKYADDVPVEPFWALLGREGKRVFSFDVAQTRPVKNFNGVNICAWGSEYPAWPRSSWPKALVGEMVRKHGEHPLVNQYRLSIKPETEAEYEAFYEKLTTGLERKGRICLDVLGREPFDVAVIVFPEVHWAMHLLWQTYDQDHPAYDPEIRLPFENVFLDLYRKIDTWIGRFMEAMADPSVVVFSGSGLGPNYSGWHLLPEVLQRIDVAPGNGGSSGGASASVLPMKRWGAYKIRKVEDTLSLNVIETLKKTVPAPLWDKATRRLLYAGSRWNESKAFCLPNDYSGAIRINLQGREPDGKVAPGKEYDAVCAEITAELKALVNPETGRTAVADVLKLADLYPEDELGDFPDLIVTWANDAPITALESPRIGTVRGDFPERRSGAHRNDCFIVSNRRLNGQAAGHAAPDILDIAPSVFELASVKAPDYFDGRSLLV